MVNIDGYCPAPPLGLFSLALSHEPNLHADYLMNRYSLGFVALKIGLLSLLGCFVHHGFFVMAPRDIFHMLMAWTWRDSWGLFQILLIRPIKCNVSQAVMSSKQFNLFIIHLKYCLILHFIGLWVGIKSKRANLILRWWCFIGLYVLLGFLCQQELTVLFLLTLYYVWQYDDFLTRDMVCF